MYTVSTFSSFSYIIDYCKSKLAAKRDFLTVPPPVGAVFAISVNGVSIFWVDFFGDVCFGVGTTAAEPKI